MYTGHELKAVRTETLGMTQEEMARELGVSRPTLSSWENAGEEYVGRIVYLSVQALLRLPDTRSWGQDGLQTFRSLAG